MTTTFAAGSRPYLYVPVTITIGPQPLTLTVDIAVVPTGTQPGDADWLSAVWAAGQAHAQLDGTQPRGSYTTFSRITDGPEMIVKQCPGTITIT